MRITIDTTDTRTVCQKCERTGIIISRHHKGFDSYVGRFNAKVRREYQQFHDCCPLCDDCHMEIHWLYLPFVQEWQAAGVFTPKAALALRTLLIDVCDQWLSGSLTPEKQGRPVSQEFKKQWKVSSSLTRDVLETG